MNASTVGLQLSCKSFGFFVAAFALPVGLMAVLTTCDLRWGPSYISSELRAAPKEFAGSIVAFGQVATAVLFGVVMAAAGALQQLGRVRGRLEHEARTLELGSLDRANAASCFKVDSEEYMDARSCVAKNRYLNPDDLHVVRGAALPGASDAARREGTSRFRKILSVVNSEEKKTFLSVVRAHRVPLLCEVRDDVRQTGAAVFTWIAITVGLAAGLTVCCFSPDVLAASLTTWLINRLYVLGPVDGNLDYVYGLAIICLFTVLMLVSVYCLVKPTVRALWMRFDDWL